MQRLQLGLVDVHHRMVVGHQQHLFAALHQRAHERRHEGGLGDAGGLALALADRILDDRALGGIVGLTQQGQLLGHRQHQLPIYAVVPVNLLHQAALGGQLLQHVALQAAQHQALPAQMLAQQLRLGHDGAVVAVAPLPGETLPVAEEVEVQDVHHVPDLAAVVVDGRAGQADAVLAGLGEQACSAVLSCAVAAQLLNLVEDDRAEAALRQHVLPAPQQQVVDEINIRLGQGIGLQPPDHVHAQVALLVQEAGDLALPVAQQVGRGHDDRGIGCCGGEEGQRLHRLAQTHVVRQQAAPRGQQEGQALLLEVQQLSGEALCRGICVLRHPPGLLPANGVVPGLLQCAVPALPVTLAHLQRIAQHQPVQIADHPTVRREARNAPTPTVAAGEEALGQLRHAGLALDRPAL